MIRFALPLLLAIAGNAWGHDMAAWTDPARDKWFRSLRVPNSNTSCCDLRDGAAIDLDKVRQELDGSWSVDLGGGFIPVPPDRVVLFPPSIDGLPYVFLRIGMPGSKPDIRCFVAPVGTY
jgi:hypothetical protein